MYTTPRKIENFPLKKIQLLRKITLTVAVVIATANVYAFPDFAEAKSRADSGDSHAQAIVATYFALGWETNKNFELAIQYAKQSSEAGNPLGKFRLGAMMRNGEGIPKDETEGLALQSEGVKIWLQTFDNNDPFSLTAFGVALFQGKVISQNKAMAARLYRKAADMGYAPAQFNFAMCARDGQGIPKDADLYSAYIDKAAENGYQLAKEIVIQPASELARSTAPSKGADSSSSSEPKQRKNPPKLQTAL